MSNPCNMAQKSQTLLRKSIQKTKIILHKAFLNVKSFLFRGYRKLPNIPTINPSLSGRNSKQKNTESKGFRGQWETSFDEVEKRKDNGLAPRAPKNDDPVYEPPPMCKIQERVKPIYGIMLSKNKTLVHETPAMHKTEKRFRHVFDIMPSEVQNNGDAESHTNIAQQLTNGKITKEKRSKKSIEAILRRELSSRSLAKRMKELEMMDVKDVDHVLDVEEALHHYSRITSPVYLEIVDKFFTDMYHEYLLPQPTLSANSSMRSSGSMRRLGPVKL